jgi:hypothetical protein
MLSEDSSDRVVANDTCVLPATKDNEVKQIPVDTIYYLPVPGTSSLGLLLLVPIPTGIARPSRCYRSSVQTCRLTTRSWLKCD